MQTVREAKPFPAYGSQNTARVVKARDGTFRTVGAGYAGRVRYRAVERAERAVEANAQFTGWAA
jgi:hypothetical protein